MQSAQFTSQDDVCGYKLQTLVCKGHVLITKVLKAANEIPPCFLSGYEIEDFSSRFNNEHGKNDGSDTSSFTSTVLHLFGGKKGGDAGIGGGDKKSGGSLLQMIRSQATSYRHNSISTGPCSPLEDDGNEYIPMLVDFSYLTNPDKFDGLVQNLAADEEHFLERKFALKYRPILLQYYDLFEEIYNYYFDINCFTTDLDKGRFVQHTLRSLLLESHEARQLLCELLHVYGSLLLLLDIYIPGEIRERLIIAHYRFTNERKNGKVSNFEAICKMFQRSTSSIDSNSNIKQKRSEEKPKKLIQADFFTRLPLPQTVVLSIIECLVSVELYNEQVFAFPSHSHRSVRLAQQGSMLAVILLFNTQTMKDDSSMMRQIVDKFFHDSWIVPLYNGSEIDLSIEWSADFPAAMESLNDVINGTNVEKLNYDNMKIILACIDEIKRYLAQNTLTELFLLDHGSSLMDFLRDTNVALRWQILHQKSYLCSKIPNSNSTMIVDDDDILSLILLLSQLEVETRESYRRLLQNRNNIWSKSRDSGVEKMTNLSKHFFGNEILKTVEKSEGLGRWFASMAEEIRFLKYDSSVTGGDIQLCIEALDEIKQLDLIDSNAQVMSILDETQINLIHMAKSANIKDNICFTIDAISDFSYARERMESLVSMLHSKSMRDPKSVTLLRAFFLKMGTFLKGPSSRLQQNAQRLQDLTFVTQFYETAMLAFVKETLDIIPMTIFSSTLARIADFKEKSLASMPEKIEADRLSDYSHFEDRYKLAKITSELSVLTKGIFTMKETLIGTLEIKPKSILEEGLRKELVRQVSAALHNSLQFNIPNGRTKQALTEHLSSCIHIFKNLGNRIEGVQRSMIWLQDFLEVDGIFIFRTEISRVMKQNTERELANLRKENMSNNSSYLQSEDGVLIPQYPRTESDPTAATFMGRTMNALLQLTEPKFTTYSSHLYGWFLSSGEQICGMKTMSSLRYAIGIEGVRGVERLLSCSTRNELLRFVKFYNSLNQTYGVILEQFRDLTFPEWKSPKDGHKIYDAVLKKLSKLMVPLMSTFCRIGQLQLLRKLLKNELRLGLDSKVMHSYDLANKAMISQVMSTNEYSSILEETSEMMSLTGGGDAISTVFIQTNSLEGLPSLIVLFVIRSLRELTFDSDFGAFVGKEDESIDGWSMVAGIATLLRQFHPSYTKSVMSLLSQYLLCNMATQLEKAKVEDLPRVSKESRNIIIFMRQLRSIANLESSILYQYIPQHIMDMVTISY